MLLPSAHFLRVETLPPPGLAILLCYLKAVSDCGIVVIYDAAVADEKLARELLELSQNTQRLSE